MNIMMLLEMAASGFGDRIAIGGRADGITYQQLFDHSGAAAKQFADAGVDHVGLVDISTPCLPVALFGSAWAGLPFVPMNYRLEASALQGLIERVAPSLVVCGDDYLGNVDSVSGTTVADRHGFLAGVASGESAAPEWGMDAEDIAVLLFTSGTTGAPKAAVLRHKHLVSYIFGSVEFMGAGDEEATLISVPPYHVAGMAAILSSVYAGRRIVQLPNFDANAWIDLCRTEGVTHAMVVPTMLSRIVEQLEDEGGGTIPTLRAISYGGGKMPQPVIERALELMPDANFVNAYGLTETSSTIALLGPDDHRDALASSDPAVRRRLSSVGRPLPTIEVSIRDEEGAEVSVGEPGEIWVRGEQVSGEYLGRDSSLNPEGWFHTNDGGSVDSEGYLFVSGRIDDVIIRGGENISPGEIEDVLLDHAEVSDAAAIGVADQQWGESIAVAVVRRENGTVDADELTALIVSKLRSSRRPDHVVFVDELPYNETGKLLRRVLRDDLAHLGDGST